VSGTFFGFNTALRGLFAQQKAMNTSSHNIANANTPGYTRQQVIMEASTPFPVPSVNRPGGAGQLGTGVDVNEVRRIRDKFLDYQIRMELGSLGQWEQREEVLKRVETVFMEPSETGLSALFDQFWTAWQELSKNVKTKNKIRNFFLLFLLDFCLACLANFALNNLSIMLFENMIKNLNSFYFFSLPGIRINCQQYSVEHSKRIFINIIHSR